jgi:hypothetical protein
VPLKISAIVLHLLWEGPRTTYQSKRQSLTPRESSTPATAQLDGGEPMLAVYVVAEHNPRTAEEIIKDRTGPGEQGDWHVAIAAIRK